MKIKNILLSFILATIAFGFVNAKQMYIEVENDTDVPVAFVLQKTGYMKIVDRIARASGTVHVLAPRETKVLNWEWKGLGDKFGLFGVIKDGIIDKKTGMRLRFDEPVRFKMDVKLNSDKKKAQKVVFPKGFKIKRKRLKI